MKKAPRLRCFFRLWVFLKQGLLEKHGARPVQNKPHTAGDPGFKHQTNRPNRMPIASQSNLDVKHRRSENKTSGIIGKFIEAPKDFRT